MFYLLTECKCYQFKIKENQLSNQFVYIDSIMKNNQILVELNKGNKKSKGMMYHFVNIQKQKYQLKYLSELIEKEKGMKFLFHDIVSEFQLMNIIDKNGISINLIEFIEKYYHFEELINIIKKERFESSLFSKDYLKKRNYDDSETKEEKVEK